MVCTGTIECFEQISAYFCGEKTGYLMLVNTENYNTYQEILQRLQADGNKRCIYVSDYSYPNGLPDIETAVNTAKACSEFALVGLSQALMLQSGEALERKLDELMSLPISGWGVILLDHCAQILSESMRKDLRLKNRIVLAQGDSSPLPQIRLAKAKSDCIGFEPLPDLSSLLNYLEQMSDSDLARHPVLTAISVLSVGMFRNAVYSVRTADGVYAAVCGKYPDVAGATEKSYGTDEQWGWLSEQLKNKGSFSAVVCEHFGSAANLSSHISDVMNGDDENEKWLLWLALKVFGEKSNKYLTLVMNVCKETAEFSACAYLCFADVEVTNLDFARMRSERKRLLEQLPEELPLISKYCDRVGIHEKNAVFYLSDSSDKERYEFLRCLSIYDYTDSELKRAVEGMSKPLSLYMREFTFDSTNTKLSDDDSALLPKLTAYFTKYKQQKLTNRIHDEFIATVEQYADERPYNKIKPRSMIISHLDRSGTQLFFFDALGVEYLSFIKARCEEYGLTFELEIGRCELPSITEKNKEFEQYFPPQNCRKIVELDEMKHHSTIYDYEKCELPLHLFEELEVIDTELRRIQSMLVQGTLEKALIVSDHGASRLAVRYGHESAASLQLDESGQHSGRCCPAESDPHIPFAAYEDGYSVLANYERFKGGRKANVEVHGGASLEEVLVPVITLTKRPENVELCFTEPVIFLIPHVVPTLTLYSNIPMTKPELLIDGEYIKGEFAADNRHAKFPLPKLKRKGNYIAEVYDGGKYTGVKLPFTAQKQTREVDLL